MPEPVSRWPPSRWILQLGIAWRGAPANEFENCPLLGESVRPAPSTVQCRPQRRYDPDVPVAIDPKEKSPPQAPKFIGFPDAAGPPRPRPPSGKCFRIFGLVFPFVLCFLLAEMVFPNEKPRPVYYSSRAAGFRRNAQKIIQNHPRGEKDPGAPHNMKFPSQRTALAWETAWNRPSAWWGPPPAPWK